MSEQAGTEQPGTGHVGSDQPGTGRHGIDQLRAEDQSGVDHQRGADQSGVEDSAVGASTPTSIQSPRVPLAVGDEVPPVCHDPDEIDLFMFSAASWLIHRVHYDEPFTTGHDGHRGLLVHGPLQGSWMMHAVASWLGHRARPRSITYRHSAPALAGDSIECGGSVTAVDAEAGTFEAQLWVRKSDGTLTTSGIGTFDLPPSDGHAAAHPGGLSTADAPGG